MRTAGERLGAALLAALLLAMATPARAQPGGCTIVFGEGRNATAPEDSSWDDVNERFQREVVARLEATGRRVHPLLGSTRQIAPEATVPRLLWMAHELGCITLVETTVFADADSQTLVARLRVYPVLPAVAGQSGVAGLRFGEPVYVNQHDMALSADVLARFRPDRLAAEMAEGYLRQNAARARPG